VDTDTGELRERRLQHREEAEKFYRDLAAQGRKVRVGMEASGHARWFERLLAERISGIIQRIATAVLILRRSPSFPLTR
jgi:hypothetical protein